MNGSTRCGSSLFRDAQQHGGRQTGPFVRQVLPQQLVAAAANRLHELAKTPARGRLQDFNALGMIHIHRRHLTSTAGQLGVVGFAGIAGRPGRGQMAEDSQPIARMNVRRPADHRQLGPARGTQPTAAVANAEQPNRHARLIGGPQRAERVVGRRWHQPRTRDRHGFETNRFRLFAGKQADLIGREIMPPLVMPRSANRRERNSQSHCRRAIE